MNMLNNVLSDGGGELTSAQKHSLVLIVEARPLQRQLLHMFLELSAQMRVASSPSINEWLRLESKAEPTVILLSIPDGGCLPVSMSELMIPEDDPLASVPVVVQSNDRPAHQVLDMLKIGVRGFIPSSVSTEVALQALRLVCVGGTFVPPSCLHSLPDRSAGNIANILTERQLQVAEGIRQGKPNKIIAHELNICESTVKVNVRAIMKKLKAKNRTEVAYIYSSKLSNLDTSGKPAFMGGG